MIGNPTVPLVQIVERAQQANEQKIAAEVGAVHQDISTEAALHLRHYAAWCKSRGIKSTPPCVPTSIALYVRTLAAADTPPDRIMDALWALEAVHDNSNCANPVATAVVRAELGKVLKLEGQPRSWPKADRLKFNSLPIEIQAVIERRERQNCAALRRVQNDLAALKQQKESNS